MEKILPRIALPCGHNAELWNEQWICDHCNIQIGSVDEPADCKEKRENAEPYKNDYWMDINYGPNEEPDT